MLPPPLPNQPNAYSPALRKPPTFSWDSSPPHPWRRYLARMLDVSVNGILIFLCLGMVLGVLSPQFAANFFSIFEKPEGRLLESMLTTFVATFLTAAFIGFTGSSIGKFFFGLRVMDKDNRPLGYKTAFKREMMVWVRGLGLGVPIIMLFTAYSAYKKLLKDGNTTWDQELGCQVVYRSNSIKQIALGCIGFIIFLGVAAWTRLPN